MDREIGREGRYETGRQEERQVKKDSQKGRKRERCRLEKVKGRDEERQVKRQIGRDR